MKPQVKTYQFKLGETGQSGEFKAVFSTMNVIDKDGDVTLPGAFGEQQVIIAAYNHGSWGAGTNGLPVGKGRIYEQGNDAIVEGKFFLDTTAGSETYRTIKNVGDLQEWSYSLPQIEAESSTIDGRVVRLLKKIKVNEVSPVLMGVGENTRLLSIKSGLKTACPQHSTATDSGSWDAGAAVRRLRSGEDKSYYDRVFAWNDSEGDSSVKSSYKFPHHFVHSDGEPGAASTKACVAGIAVLNGGRGGANIPDADRQGVYDHLAKHLKDANIEPPELKALDALGHRMPLKDHVEILIADAEEVIERLEDVAMIREEKGREYSEPTMRRAVLLKSALSDLIRRIEGIQEKHDSCYKEFLHFQQIIQTRRATDAISKVD